MIIGVASADYQRPNIASDGKEHWGGAGWARIGQYVPLWRALGHEVHVGTLWAKQDHLDVAVDVAGDVRHVTPDVLYLQRLMHDMSHMIKNARRYGQIVIQDVDDWYWGLDPRNQAFLHSHPKHNATENVPNYSGNLSASNIITVSTPYLAQRLKNSARTDIRVIPNYIDTARFSPVNHQVERPTIGWAGSTSHRSGDLAVLKGSLSRLLVDADFQHSGHLDGSALFAEEVGLPVERVGLLPRTDAERYPSILDFQIGLVPLRDTPFNHAKSDIKGLEYAACGIPFVASWSPAYAALQQQWGDVMQVAKRPQQMINGLKRFLPQEVREEVAPRLIELVKERDYHKGVQHYVDLFSSLDV